MWFYALHKSNFNVSTKKSIWLFIVESTLHSPQTKGSLAV
jgi:hypothetical protein